LGKLRYRTSPSSENSSTYALNAVRKMEKGASVPFSYVLIIIEKLNFGLNTSMFKENKYTKYYTLITDAAKTRNNEGYVERHHIIPQSLGGSNHKDNLVDLTAREHFICHWLLIKMTEGEARGKMLYALHGMKAENKYQQRYSSSITARVYERYRIEHSKNHSTRMKGKEPWNKGRKLEGDELEVHLERTRNRRKPSPETVAAAQAIRIAKVTGQKRSIETKEKMSLAKKGIAKGPMTEEHRAAISAGGKGIKKHEGHADKVRQANLGVVSINKDGAEKKVKRDTLDQWLADGWALGGRKRIKIS
jgi:hypothetical protein